MDLIEYDFRSLSLYMCVWTYNFDYGEERDIILCALIFIYIFCCAYIILQKYRIIHRRHFYKCNAYNMNTKNEQMRRETQLQLGLVIVELDLQNELRHRRLCCHRSSDSISFILLNFSFVVENVAAMNLIHSFISTCFIIYL